jgi:hypothetical protein
MKEERGLWILNKEKRSLEFWRGRRKEEYEDWIKQNEIENLEEEGGRRNMKIE